MGERLRQTALPFLSLFVSLSTLLCCALPAALVALGLGAVMAGLISAVPQVVWLSERKETLFVVGGVLLTIAAVGMYLSRNAPCPADLQQAKVCGTARVAARVTLSISAVVYSLGFFFAFIASKIL